MRNVLRNRYTGLRISFKDRVAQSGANRIGIALAWSPCNLICGLTKTRLPVTISGFAVRSISAPYAP